MASFLDFIPEEGQILTYNLAGNEYCDYNQDLTIELDRAYSSLSAVNPYIHFDLHLSPDDLEIVKKLNIDQLPEEYNSLGHSKTADKYIYRNYGDSDTLHTEVTNYIEKLSYDNNPIASKTADLISRLLCSVVASEGGESALLYIRSYTPTTQPYIAKWHIDACHSEKHFVVISIPAPFKNDTTPPVSTLFYPPSDEIRQAFASKAVKSDVGTMVNKEFASVIDPSNISSAQFGQGTVLLCGGAHLGAIHTHPPIDDGRMLLVMGSSSKTDLKSFEILNSNTNSRVLIP